MALDSGSTPESYDSCQLCCHSVSPTLNLFAGFFGGFGGGGSLFSHLFGRDDMFGCELYPGKERHTSCDTVCFVAKH